jgi:hypothetical protein
MAAVTIVDGVMEGINLLTNLLSAASQVSSAIQQAQSNGTPLDWTTILGAETNAEANVLSAIAAAKAAGK